MSTQSMKLSLACVAALAVTQHSMAAIVLSPQDPYRGATVQSTLAPGQLDSTSTTTGGFNDQITINADPSVGQSGQFALANQNTSLSNTQSPTLNQLTLTGSGQARAVANGVQQPGNQVRRTQCDSRADIYFTITESAANYSLSVSLSNFLESEFSPTARDSEAKVTLFDLSGVGVALPSFAPGTQSSVPEAFSFSGYLPEGTYLLSVSAAATAQSSTLLPASDGPQGIQAIFNNLNFVVSQPVPEPTTLGGLAGVGILVLRRRRG